MGFGENIQEHLKEHETLGIKRFNLGNDVDYLEIDPDNHTAKLYLNSVLIWSQP